MAEEVKVVILRLEEDGRHGHFFYAQGVDDPTEFFSVGITPSVFGEETYQRIMRIIADGPGAVHTLLDGTFLMIEVIMRRNSRKVMDGLWRAIRARFYSRADKAAEKGRKVS